MSFLDLPADWPHRPLTDPTLVADVLDLVVSDAVRQRGSLVLLLCRSDDRLAQPCVVDDVDLARHDATHREILEPFVALLAQMQSGGSLIVAVTRPSGLRPTDDDRAWHQAAIDACREGPVPVRLLGVHVVTRDGIERLPDAPLPASRAS
ncbi:MAG TPA: hypothetical protein VFJ97_08415 [Dermatophilaceae bacterium]|nr:hypothetical protein [Dermatophilaceae bacterium]